MPELAPFVTVRAPKAIVTTVDHLATGAGIAILRMGGSAADAAVAANAVLAVTTQHMCGLGGDLLAVLCERRGGPAALLASGRAGSGADVEELRDEGARRMPFRGDSRAVTIPGCVDGWLALHERFGRLPLSTLLEPAREYATDGFPASPLLVDAVQSLAGVAGTDDYDAAGPLRVGSRVRRPGVAEAFDAIIRDGRAGFYEGEFGRGLLELAPAFEPADLAAPNADWVEPLGVRVWGHDLWTVPPSSQGYLTLSSAWIAEGLDLPDDPDDPLWAHLLIEASIQAGYDRDEVLHEHADGAALLAPGRLLARRAAIDRSRASALPAPARAGGTIHLNVVDADGMTVSLTQSNAAGFGAHLVVPGLRIFLQNRGIGFNLEPGHPAAYGPRRRPPHTLCPTLVTAPDGAPRFALGTMGADSQPQILLQLLARLLVTGQDAAAAVAAPRWFLAATSTERFGVWSDPTALTVQLEGNAPEGWREGLRGRGHDVEVVAPFSYRAGHAHVVELEADNVAGAADPRSLVGAASGF